MVAGNKIHRLLGEERNTQSELKLSTRWAPHQGHNTAYVDLRSELVHTARRGGLAFLLTAEGAVPPSNTKLEGRRTRFAQNEMQEMIDAGELTEEEMEKMEKDKSRYTQERSARSWALTYSTNLFRAGVKGVSVPDLVSAKQIL